jgi:hypothetical protein
MPAMGFNCCQPPVVEASTNVDNIFGVGVSFGEEHLPIAKATTSSPTHSVFPRLCCENEAQSWTEVQPLDARVTYDIPAYLDAAMMCKLEERPRMDVDGGFYTGQWYDDYRHGVGKLEKSGVGVYQGQLRYNEAFGNGRFTKLSGDVYEGQWQHDCAHGDGSYLHTDGSSYRGQWFKDLKHGVGAETWSDGSTYEGQYLKGKKHGAGVYQSLDHALYEGQFFNDELEGEGRYIFSDERIYSGQWLNSRTSGSGNMWWTDGRHYEGQFEDDKRSGFGTFSWPDGRKYEGNWYQGRQHGCGTYMDARGRSWTGDWNNGQKVKPPGIAASESSSKDTSRYPSPSITPRDSMSQASPYGGSRDTTMPSSRDPLIVPENREAKLAEAANNRLKLIALAEKYRVGVSAHATKAATSRTALDQDDQGLHFV